MDVEVERVADPATPSSEEVDSIRITRQGKIRVWVKKALDFFQCHPERPLVLYSAPADVSTSTIARLVSVVEIIKREYLKGRDVSAGDASGLHQYNQLLFEERSKVPTEEGEERRDALQLVLDGRSHTKQSLAPYMRITLSATAIARDHGTYQTPAIRRMSKRMRKRLRKQGENK